MTDLETVYDAEIAPLMQQIIDIAQRCDMPFVASFQLNDGSPADPTPLMCTSASLPPGCSRQLRCAADHVLPERKPAVVAAIIMGPRGPYWQN
jgi:hypothetical protein